MTSEADPKNQFWKSYLSLFFTLLQGPPLTTQSSFATYNTSGLTLATPG